MIEDVRGFEHVAVAFRARTVLIEGHVHMMARGARFLRAETFHVIAMCEEHELGIAVSVNHHKGIGSPARLGSGVVVLGTRGEGKVGLVAAVTEDLVGRVRLGVGSLSP